MLAFILSGLGCAFAGLCYAEFAAMIPLAGSAYTYAYATLGETVRLDYWMGSDARVRDGREYGFRQGGRITLSSFYQSLD